MRGNSEGFFHGRKSKLVSQELYGEKEKRMKGFGGETRGTRTLGRPKRRWKDNLKMYLK